MQYRSSRRAIFIVALSVAGSSCGLLSGDELDSCPSEPPGLTINADTSGTARATAAWPDSNRLVDGVIDLTILEADPWCVDGCAAALVVSQSGLGVPGQAVQAAYEEARSNKRYLAEATVRCGGEVTVHRSKFSRMPAADSPLADVSVLGQRAYASPGQTFTLLEPTGSSADDLLVALRMKWLPMLSVHSVDEETGQLQVELAWTRQDGDYPLQKPCSTTMSIAQGSLRRGLLEVASPSVSVVTGEGVTRVYDFELTATPSLDGGALRDIEFTGAFDMRDLSAELGYASGLELCADTEELGLRCQPCPPDGEPVCVSVHIGGIDAYATDDALPEPLQCADAVGPNAFYDYLDERIISYDSEAGVALKALDFDGNVVWTYQPPQIVGAIQWNVSVKRFIGNASGEIKEVLEYQIRLAYHTGGEDPRKVESRLNPLNGSIWYSGSTVIAEGPGLPISNRWIIDPRDLLRACSVSGSAPSLGGLLFMLAVTALRRRRKIRSA